MKVSSDSRGRLRFWTAGILAPEGDREGDGAAADRDVGDVERRPPERAHADVEKIDDPSPAADPVDEVARRPAGDEAQGERLDQLEDSFRLYRCHQIMNCVEACPKDLNPARAITDIKRRLASRGS